MSVKIRYGIAGLGNQLGNQSFVYEGDREDSDGILDAIRERHKDLGRLHIYGYAVDEEDNPLFAAEEALSKAEEKIREHLADIEYRSRKKGEESSILLTAHSLVHGNRGQDYGHPIDDFTRTAKMWSAILGVEVSAEQMALCMIAVKMSRLCNTQNHTDSVVDIAGYAETYSMVIEERKKRGTTE